MKRKNLEYLNNLPVSIKSLLNTNVNKSHYIALHGFYFEGNSQRENDRADVFNKTRANFQLSALSTD